MVDLVSSESEDEAENKEDEVEEDEVKEEKKGCKCSGCGCWKEATNSKCVTRGCKMSSKKSPKKSSMNDEKGASV